MSLPKNEQLVIGLVGNAASGKDHVASFFVTKGFIHFSTSDLVRQELNKRGLVPSRAQQTLVANELRLINPAYFVQESLRQANDSREKPDKVLLSGIYAPSEGEYIIKELNGYLVGVVSHTEPEKDIQLRYSRLNYRADGDRDKLTIEEFQAAHIRENSGIRVSEANVSRLLSLARFTINNDGVTSPGELSCQVQTILDGVGVGQ